MPNLQWEIELIQAMQAHFSSGLILLSKMFTLMGQEYPLVLIVLIFYYCIDKKFGKRLCVQLLTTLVWVPLIKNLVLRVRPYFAHPEIDILIPAVPTADPYDMMAQGYSFPSAHSACAAAAYPSVARRFKKKAVTIIAIVLTFCIGLSRFCVGAHYPTDVLVGWFIGGFAAIIISFAYKRIKNENLFNFILLLTGVPGLFYCESEDFFTGFGLMLGACFAYVFEEKFVKFEKAEGLLKNIVRVAFGIAIFLLFAQGIKFIFGESLTVRVIRYAAGSFAALGLCPMAFELFEGKKNEHITC